MTRLAMLLGDQATIADPKIAAPAIQALASIGAFVGGWLARQRRLELETTNRKLRHINTELRRRRHEVGTFATQVYVSYNHNTQLACLKYVVLNTNASASCTACQRSRLQWPSVCTPDFRL